MMNENGEDEGEKKSKLRKEYMNGRKEMIFKKKSASRTSGWKGGYLSDCLSVCFVKIAPTANNLTKKNKKNFFLSFFLSLSFSPPLHLLSFLDGLLVKF